MECFPAEEEDEEETKIEGPMEKEDEEDCKGANMHSMSINQFTSKYPAKKSCTQTTYIVL